MAREGGPSSEDMGVETGDDKLKTMADIKGKRGSRVKEDFMERAGGGDQSAEAAKLDLGTGNARINELLEKLQAGEEKLTDDQVAELDLFERERDCTDHGAITYDLMSKRSQKAFDAAGKSNQPGAEDLANRTYKKMGELPPDQMDEIYDRYPQGTRNMLEGSHINVHSGSTVEARDTKKPEEYIEAVMASIDETIKSAIDKNVQPASDDDIERQVGMPYKLKADGRTTESRKLTKNNWSQHISSGKWKETYANHVKEATNALRGFGEAARVAGDKETFELVEKALTEIERKKLELA